MTTQILCSPPPSTPLHVFAAQTLKLKLKYDIHQHPTWRSLSPGSTFHALGTAYVTLGPSSPAARNALASCLAVHAVQLWANPSSAAEPPPHTLVEWSLSLPPPLLIAALTAIAEESRASSQPHALALSGAFPSVASLGVGKVTASWASSAPTNTENYLDQATGEPKPWILGLLDAVGRGGSEFEDDVDAAVAVFRRLRPVRGGSLAREVVARCGSRRPGPGEEVSWARLWCELGEACVEDIAVADGRDLVTRILEVTGSDDEDVSRVSMVFWWRFVECLENVEPYEFRQGWVDFYEPVVVRLVGAVVKLMEDRSDILEEVRVYEGV